MIITQSFDTSLELKTDRSKFVYVSRYKGNDRQVDESRRHQVSRPNRKDFVRNFIYGAYTSVDPESLCPKPIVPVLDIWYDIADLDDAEFLMRIKGIRSREYTDVNGWNFEAVGELVDQNPQDLMDYCGQVFGWLTDEYQSKVLGVLKAQNTRIYTYIASL